MKVQPTTKELIAMLYERLPELFDRAAPVQHPVAFFDWYDNAHWGNEDFKEGCHRSWNAAIKYTTPPAQPAVPEGWQLIETAPQDGTKILGWNEEFGARETQMNFYGEGSLGFAAWKSGKGPKENGWNWSEPKSNWGHTWKPTHWKPLLTPCNTTTPNVATPPAAQRQWAGLTDEERMEIYNKPLTISSCIGAVESKLKEKNT
jgi:hypothetical protein